MTAAPLDEAWLRSYPLPTPDAAGDKEDKGKLLIIGGSAAVPGALLLCTESAMRVGAGKVKMATIDAAAVALGLLFPEAAVLSLPADSEGEIATGAVPKLITSIQRADAILIGPAMASGENATAVTSAALAHAPDGSVIVLDAGAINCCAQITEEQRSAGHSLIITPHCGEMAALLDMEKAEVQSRLEQIAILAARRFGAFVVLKSRSTVIATPFGEALTYASECPGLGTAGSGDVLAGIIGGLCARGLAPLSAAAWGVWLHGESGRLAAREIAGGGFLARELPPRLPVLLESMTL